MLFDLRGWGGGGAPEVLAMRPAPVQVNWLAYPGTSGAPWIDYVLADRFVLPESMAHDFSETVVLAAALLPAIGHRRARFRRRLRARDCGLPERGDDGAASCSAASTTATSSTRAA